MTTGRPDFRAGFVRFALVGAAGFVVDASVLYGALALGFGPIAGRLLSYLAAATATWLMNRRFTFASEQPPSFREWASFIAANAVGGLVNLALYAVLVTQAELEPVIGVAAGSIAGLAINYTLSRFVVFRRG